MSVTFIYHESVKANPIFGSSGSKAKRLQIEGVEDPNYFFRCKAPKQSYELELLLPQNASRRGCCPAGLPRYVETTLKINGMLQRVEINLNSMSKRCSFAKDAPVSKREVYDACVDGSLADLLEELFGSSSKWYNRLSLTRLSEEEIMLVVPLIKKNWKEWKRKCDEKNIPSYFCAPEGRRQCGIEYFQDGETFVHYREEGNKKLAVNIGEPVIHAEVREIDHLEQFLIYKTAAELFQNSVGILRIYRTSEYPEKNRFHVFHERYKCTLEHFLMKGMPHRPPPLGSKGPGGKPFVPGGSLRNENRLSPQAKVKVATDLLAGLQTLHNANIVHFRLEPSSLCVIPQSGQFPAEAAIGRFEFARLFDQDQVGGKVVTHVNREFIPPELDEDSPRFPQNPFAADIFSLGKCLQKLFSIEKNPKVDEITRCMCQPNPKERPTATETLSAFQELAVPSERSKRRADSNLSESDFKESPSG